MFFISFFWKNEGSTLLPVAAELCVPDAVVDDAIALLLLVLIWGESVDVITAGKTGVADGWLLHSIVLS